MNVPVKRALISVTDKKSLDSFAKALAGRGVEIIASGGTAKAIRDAGVPVIDVSDVTAFPEIMNGRVKTLHPKIHGGILAERDNRAHLEQAAKHAIGLIDLVVVNLYRFRQAAENPSLGEKDIVEEIDIGGPALIRAAAKNFHSVAVVVEPGDYDAVLKEMAENGGSVTLDMRRKLAAKAFFHTACYDAAISRYFERILSPPGDLPASMITAYRKKQALRYGENPHLRGALYAADQADGGLAQLAQLQGKELSYNNIQDLHSAYCLARDLGKASCAIIKHMNPSGAANCGVAAESFTRARLTDETSAYGSVVAFNDVVDRRVAETCGDIFLEVIVARGFKQDALEIFSKKKNLRLVTIPAEEWDKPMRGWNTKEIGELLLVQDRDEGFPELESWRIATARKPSPEEERALGIAWRIAKHVRSNAIVICDAQGTIGVGAGQMSRVDSCRIAVDKARREGMRVEGASAASDAFFPFPDGVEALASAGVKAIVQPGGSVRDDEVVAAADRLGISMVMTGVRHFKH
jgi:phosphoribosylaminoimidazolecarboxamide formyltransferase / IMP cyclohydrolase